MSRKSGNRPGFSVVELMVVLGIIVLLMTILLPVVGRLRAKARSTKCLANLQQWGYSFQMYLNTDHGQPITESADQSHLFWWEVLAQQSRDIDNSLLCPDASSATEKWSTNRSHGWVIRGSATSAWQATAVVLWHPPGPPPNHGVLVRHSRTSDHFVGSYGINLWTYHHRSPTLQDQYIHYPTKDAPNIPLLGDSIAPWTLPDNRVEVPKDLQHPANDPDAKAGIESLCLDRHLKAVNIVFLDGHAEHIPLATLWTLRWSESSTPRHVIVPRP